MNSRPRKAIHRFSEASIDGELVLMCLESGDFYSLSGSALRVWQLIDGEHSRNDIITVLAQEYSCTLNDLTEDVDAFLGKLRGAGLLLD